MTDSLRVVVADDQQLVRTGFRMILAADGIGQANLAAAPRHNRGRGTSGQLARVVNL